MSALLTHGIIYPRSYFSSMSPDEMFEEEFKVVQSLGIPIAFYDQESLSFDEFVKLSHISPEVSYIYRGWMLSEDEYGKLERSVERKGAFLAITVEEYLRSHWLVNWFDVFKPLTFNTVELQDPSDRAEIEHAIQLLGCDKFFVKDYVKSGSGSVAESPDRLFSVIENFIHEKEDSLAGRILVREFKELKSDVAELRSWWVNGKLIHVSTHPNFLDKPEIPVNDKFLSLVQNAVVQLGGLFITVDFALTESEEWVVVEVGNGQVSGLPSDLTSTEVADMFLSLTNR